MSRELNSRLLLLQYPRDYVNKKGKKKHNYTGWAKLTVRPDALKMFARKKSKKVRPYVTSAFPIIASRGVPIVSNNSIAVAKCYM